MYRGRNKRYNTTFEYSIISLGLTHRNVSRENSGCEIVDDLFRHMLGASYGRSKRRRGPVDRQNEI
jgi:hypothetical protein